MVLLNVNPGLLQGILCILFLTCPCLPLYLSIYLIVYLVLVNPMVLLTLGCCKASCILFLAILSSSMILLSITLLTLACKNIRGKTKKSVIKIISNIWIVDNDCKIANTPSSRLRLKLKMQFYLVFNYIKYQNQTSFIQNFIYKISPFLKLDIKSLSRSLLL